jgi:hypothetical protein
MTTSLTSEAKWIVEKVKDQVFALKNLASNTYLTCDATSCKATSNSLTTDGHFMSIKYKKEVNWDYYAVGESGSPPRLLKSSYKCLGTQGVNS